MTTIAAPTAWLLNQRITIGGETKRLAEWLADGATGGVGTADLEAAIAGYHGPLLGPGTDVTIEQAFVQIDSELNNLTLDDGSF